MIDALVLLLVQTLAPAVAPGLVNAGFDAPRSGGFPTGWKLRARGSPTGPNLSVAGGQEGGNTYVRLTATDPKLPAPTRMMQTIDATAWRGRHVRLSARFRVRQAGKLIGLMIDVRRPDPWPNGFFDNMYDRPIGAADGWRTVTLDAYVEPDATGIDLGIVAAGAVDFDLDDVAIVEAVPDPRPAAPKARAYLNAAVDALRAKHIRAKEIDWAVLRARVQSEIGGARAPADTYRAIRSAFGTMGDNHAMLRPPEPVATASAGAPAPRPAGAQPLPSYRLVDGRIGMVSLPGLSIYSDADMAHGARYVATLREGLGAFDRVPVCGWIVDLRANTGGNMWPMLNGLTPLLGAAPYGHFVTPDAQTTPWILKDGIVTLPGMPATAIAGASRWSLRHGALPVAVLIGPATASSGEATAIAFSGRADTRSFGQPSGGYTTANEGVRLSDGAMMFIPTSWERDRAGRDFRDKIAPDEVTAPGAELAAARTWLSARCR